MTGTVLLVPIPLNMPDYPKPNPSQSDDVQSAQGAHVYNEMLLGSNSSASELSLAEESLQSTHPNDVDDCNRLYKEETR
jgi:hypothetical protein